MKILVFSSFIALVACAPHQVEKRSPDYYIYVPPSRGSQVLPRSRYVSPSLPSFSFPRGYFLEVDLDDRKKREAVHPTTRRKRSADFDDDDHFLFYQPATRGLATYSATPQTTISQSYVPRSQVYYYIDDDDFFDRRKKRSADFDLDDDHYYFASPSVTPYAVVQPQRPVVTTYAVANPQPVVQARTSYSPFFYYDFDDKK